MSINHVVKRDGAVRPYHREKISNAIYSALNATDQGKEPDAEGIAKRVERELEERYEEADQEVSELLEDVSPCLGRVGGWCAWHTVCGVIIN